MDVLLDVQGDTSLWRNLETDYNCTQIKSIDLDKIYNGDYPLIKKEETTKKKKYSSKDIDLEKFEADMGWTKSRSSKTYDLTEEIAQMKEEVNPLDNILKKSVIRPGFERLHVVPPYELSKHQLEKRKWRQKKKMGAGAGWFNMRTPQITPEIRHDLEVLQMRSVLDPKHFYKKNSMKGLPKYFHVGKVIDSPLDFYSSRLTKKERKRTIVDELMADAEFKKYNKRKYKEIIEEKKKTHYKAYRHAKKLKERKRK